MRAEEKRTCLQKQTVAVVLTGIDKNTVLISNDKNSGQTARIRAVAHDDATSEHYSMSFVEEEGTASSFRGMAEVIETRGLPSSLSTDRGSHYWLTPEAGSKVDRERPTQFGRTMHQLGVEMTPAYSPEARGRCERMFVTHQSLPPRKRGSGCPRSSPLRASTRCTTRTVIWPSTTERRSTRSSRYAGRRARDGLCALHRSGIGRHRVRNTMSVRSIGTAT